MSSIPPTVFVKGIMLFQEYHRLEVVGTEVPLTRREFQIMAKLLHRPGMVKSRESLSEKSMQNLSSLIRKLRKKITNAAGVDAYKIIKVQYGDGYYIKPDWYKDVCKMR